MEIGLQLHNLIKKGNDEALASLVSWIKQLTLSDEHALYQILNYRNSKKYTPLHELVFRKNYIGLQLLVNAGADVNYKCHGIPISHLILSVAALPNSLEFGNNSFKCILNTNKVLLDAKDDQGAQITHLAAEFNNAEAIYSIMSAVDSANRRTVLEVKDRSGLYPIHRAVMKNSVDALTALLSIGANISARTSQGYTVLHLSVIASSIECWDILSRHPEYSKLFSQKDIYQRTALETAQKYGYNVDKLELESKLELLDLTSPMKVAIITDSTCLEHHTCLPNEVDSPSAPPENIHRIEVLVDKQSGILYSSDIASNLVHLSESKSASISDVLRVHEWLYVRRLQDKCDECSTNVYESDGIGYLDGDTTISSKSFSAALKSSGAVCQAVDLVMSQSKSLNSSDIDNSSIRSAFCPIRPPGHHAGPRGVVKTNGGPDSHGFCLINNISIGAAYAMNMYRNDIKKIAIVDFDVHFGNGTEETVRWLQPGIDEFEISNEVSFGTIQSPRYKPWFDFNDSNNVFFVSVHGYGPRELGLEHLMPRVAFYPGAGKTTIPVLPIERKDSKENSKPSNGSSSDCDGVNRVVESLKEDEDGQDDDVEDYDEDGNEKDNDGEVGDVDENEIDGDDEEKVKELDDENDDEDEDEDYNLNDEEVKLINNSNLPSEDSLNKFKRLYSSTNMNSYPPLILDVGVGLVDPEVVSSSEYRHQWRNYFRDTIFPKLNKFQPDIIFISAGFDAHKKDTINAGYIALVEEDFEWITNHLVRLANTHSKGRIVSALEGGYQLNGEVCSAFAKSVKAHVYALSSGAGTRVEYSEEDLVIEKQHERKMLDDAELRKQERDARMLKKFSSPVLSAPEEQSVPVENSMSNIVTSSEIVIDVVTVEEEDNNESRKRRRPQVDYAALDLELRNEQLPTSSISL